MGLVHFKLQLLHEHMVHEAADEGVFVALAELEAEGVVELSCSGVPVVHHNGTFLTAKLSHNVHIEAYEHLTDTSAAGAVLYAKEGDVRQTVNMGVGGGNAYPAHGISVAVNRNIRVRHIFGEPLLKKLGLFLEVVGVKRAVVKNVLVFLKLCWVCLLNVDKVCLVGRLAMIAHSSFLRL